MPKLGPKKWKQFEAQRLNYYIVELEGNTPNLFTPNNSAARPNTRNHIYLPSLFQASIVHQI